jgi:hypothetical protein
MFAVATSEASATILVMECSLQPFRLFGLRAEAHPFYVGRHFCGRCLTRLHLANEVKMQALTHVQRVRRSGKELRPEPTEERKYFFARGVDESHFC